MSMQSIPRTGKVPGRRGRLVLAALVLLVCAGGAAAVWRWWRGPTPQPPELVLDGCEPRVARAIEAARADVIRQPRSGPAWGKLGRLLLVHDMGSSAAPCFAHAERFEPDNPRWPYFRAMLLLNEDPHSAVTALRRTAELCAVHDPDDTAMRLRLAEVLVEVDRPEEAAAEFQKVLSLQPDNPRALYGLGQLAAGNGDLQTARRYLQDCCTNPQTRKKAAAELARVLMRLGDTAGAAAAQRQALGAPLDVDFPDPFVAENDSLKVSRAETFRLAREKTRTGNHRDALALLKRSVREKPDYQGFLELGQTLMSMNDPARAMAALREAVRLDPNGIRAAYLLSTLLFEQAERSGTQEPLREAVAFARQAVALKPDHAFSHVYLGLALKAQGQRQEALGALRAAVQCAPDRPEPYLYLAEMLAEDGRKDEARRLMEQAGRLPLPPNDPRPRAALEHLHKLLDGKSP
jgi:tetratricopeptide (TPR) repeat protein